MKSFIEQAADSLIAYYGWENLEHVTCVLPTRRAGLYLKQALIDGIKKSNQKPCYSPHITTLSDLFSSWSQFQDSNELLLICLLYEVYLEIHNDSENALMSIDAFYAWGETLIHDFSNTDKAYPLVEAEQLFSNIVDANILSGVKLEEDVRTRIEQLIRPDSNTTQQRIMRERYQSLWDKLPLFYQHFQEKLQTLNISYEGARMKDVLKRWNDIAPTILDEKFAFIGFNYLLPAERELLERLRTQSTFYWDYDESFNVNSRAYRFVKANISHFGNQLISSNETNNPDIHIISAPYIHSQVSYVHTWLKEHYKHKGEKVGVIICNENMLEPIIYALPTISLIDNETETINITKGFPMQNTRIYLDIIRYIEDNANKEQTLLLNEIIENLIDPFLQPSDSLDEERECKNWRDLLQQESLYQARHAMVQLQNIIQQTRWQRILSSFFIFKNLVTNYLRSITLPLHSDSITDMQVMGVLETRTIDFDKLLLLNVEEGVVPKSTSATSFIPYYLRKSYGMETADETADIYAYNFFRLLKRSQHVTCVFSPIGIGNSKGMSRFLMQLLSSESYTNIHKHNLVESTTVGAQDIQLDLSKRLDLHLEPDGYLHRTSGEIFTLSPSAIKTYISCPRRFYIQYILKVKDNGDTGLLLERNDLGTLIHGTLEILYNQITNGHFPYTISTKDIAQINNNDNINNALIESYHNLNTEYEKKYQEPNHFKIEEHIFENHFIIRSVKNVLRSDAELAKTHLTIIEMESPKGHYFDMDLQKGKIKIGGRIDRIDQVIINQQKVTRILDYKSGKYSSTNMSCKTIEELFENATKGNMLQTLLYCEAYLSDGMQGDNQPIAPALYYTTQNEPHTKSQLHWSNKQPIENYIDIREEIIEKLSDIVNQIVYLSNYEMVEDKACKHYCPFKCICQRTNDADDE